MKRYAKLISLLLALTLLLSACGAEPAQPEAPAEPAAPEAETPAQPEAPAEPDKWVNPQLNDYTLTRLRLIGRGDASENFKIGFFAPKTLEGVRAFLICWSVREFDEVWSTLSALSLDELFALDKPVNRAYLMTDLSYCDGVGNTFNTAQKDVVTGEDFTEPGTHYFYAAALGDNGLLSLEKTEQTVFIEPIAEKLSIARDGDSLTGSYVSYTGGELEKTFVFLSADGYDAVHEQLKLKNRASLDALVTDGCALSFDNAQQNEFTLTLSQMKDLSGAPIDPQKCYYAYVASASAQKLLGLSYCADRLVTPETLPEASGTIGTGKGMIFPNGGAAQIGGGRGSIISTAQAAFKALPENPRIAVIGAASGSEREFWSHFYLDDSASKSFAHRLGEAGFEAVYLPLTAENRDTIGQDHYYAALIASCHGVYFTGGDQSLGMYALLQEDGSFNAVGEAVCGLFDRGGFLAGTSAGAHMLGNLCFQDSDSVDCLTNPVPQSSQLTSDGVHCGPEGVLYGGIPCAKTAAGQDILFDSHFGARGRLARLCVMQGASGAAFAAGLDENTGLAVTESVGTVYGAGTVTVLDGREAQYGAEGRFSVTGLKVYVLSAGDKFDFAAGVMLPAENKTAAAAPCGQPEELLGPSCAQAQALLSFAAGDADKAEYTVESEGATFTFTLTKGADFAAAASDKPFDTKALSDLPRTAAGPILMNIQ